MKFVDKDNKTLDELGAELFRWRGNASALVESVVKKDDLFTGVLSRISEEPKAVKPGFRLYAATLGSVAVLTVAVVAGIGLLRSGSKEVLAIKSVDPVAQQPAGARPDLPPPSVGIDESLPGRASYHPAKIDRPTMQNASYTSSRPVGPRPVPQPRDDFYAISYGGDKSETAGGHIVRVEVPRASLFALGINVPLENDSETVKADLLIGPDGVTRAIRVVK